MGFLDWLTNIDTQVLLFMNSYHTDFLDHFMMGISGKLIWVFFYATLLFAAWRIYGLKGAGIVLLSVGLLILLCDQICASLIRPWVGRMRPTNPDNPIEPYIHIVNGYRSGALSFPSCHASNTFGLAVLMALFFRRHWISITMISWSILVCFSRVYLGVHYPLDILCGMAIGAGIAYGVYRLAMWVFPLDIKQAEEHRGRMQYIPAAGVGATLIAIMLI